MAYENRWNDRDDRYGRSRDDDRYDRDDRSRGENDRSWRSEGRDRDDDRSRAWRPFGEDGPSNYGRAGARADDDRAGYRAGQWDRGGQSGGGQSGASQSGGYRGQGSFGAQASRGAFASDDDWGRGRDRDVGDGYRRDREAGFSETGGRYSDSYRRADSEHEQYGRRDQWGSNPRGGSSNEGRNFWDKAADTVSSWFGDDDARRRHEWDQVRAGEHRGRGPKGYRRSDERIRDDISDKLSDDSWLDASDIEVKVEGSEVTLNGTVASRDDKRRAEDLAERVSGVEHVQNNLRVKRAGDTTTFAGAAAAGGASSTFGSTGDTVTGASTATGGASTTGRA